MKKFLLLSALFVSSLIFAQVPQGVSYQAIALNGSGNPVVSSNVGLKLSVLNTSATGTVVYAETQTKTTNAQGLFNLVIGQGTPTSGTFAGINWATGSKFLKVEMDAAGGTNYTLVGTTQLLSVPYAMAASKFVGAPGEGITLVAPNGTPYVLSVNNAGELSLPTTGNPASTNPDNLYLYGTFNGFNPTSAALMGSGNQQFFAHKYLTAGQQIKFIAQNDPSGAVYGFSGENVTLNGSAYTAPSNGFYYISVENYNELYGYVNQYAPVLNCFNGEEYNPTYNVSTNKFSFILNGITNNLNLNKFFFSIPHVNGSSSSGNHGDFLSDGTVDFDGPAIVIPNATSTPKNFRVDLTINVNGSGNYTITQLP